MQGAPTAMLREDVHNCGLGIASVERLYTAMNYEALHRHIVDGASLRLRLGRVLPRDAVAALNRLATLANRSHVSSEVMQDVLQAADHKLSGTDQERATMVCHAHWSCLLAHGLAAGAPPGEEGRWECPGCAHAPDPVREAMAADAQRGQCEVAIQQVDGWVDDGWEPAPGGPRPPESAPAVGGRLEHVVPAGHGVV
mmetsp:Transcript_20500/g.51967  ORF Transcript_20500/g.51967 Transcript_20500/m.51967 type:complete len:197 (-) Transcript_20500:759-1349(-)